MTERDIDIIITDLSAPGGACEECDKPLDHESEILCDWCEMEAFGEHG